MSDHPLTRRDVLAGAATAGATSVAGCAGLLGSDSAGATQTDRVTGERARTLAAAHAPDIYFGVGERWFPTDPREYAGVDGDESVIDGFDAFDGYARDFTASGEPPHRTVFYAVRRYADTDLVVVQYWLYSAFDQFSVNFHWHDWELLQVFLDVSDETGDPTVGSPQLLVASAHARAVPNNEFLDPSTDRPSIISEVGSHSSALGVNKTKDTFERLPITTDIADISNGAIAVSDLPAAYGLPRGEGYRLPFALPELDGRPIHDHPDLPHVTRDHLVPPEMTIESFEGLPAPPGDLPLRETGLQFAFEDGDGVVDADYGYSLVPMSDMEVSTFTGPQLGFEFAVPSFAEDAFAAHLTTTGNPKDQPRYANPVADVTDPRHRSALSQRFDVDVTGLAGDVVGLLREATATESAPGSNGVETREPTVEGIALLESDPVAVPTFNGVVALRDVPAGDHRLTVNGAGVAPYSQALAHEEDGEATTAGVDGSVVVAANEDAVKVRAEPPADAPGVARVAVADDVAGPVYDAAPPGVGSEGGTGSEGGDTGDTSTETADSAGGTPDSNAFAVYAHREGAYTTEIEDSEGAIGAFRVNPRVDQTTATIAEPRTGKSSLTSYLLILLTETTAQAGVFADGDADGIDEVSVPDSTTEQAGEARDVVDEVVSTTTGAADGSTTDAPAETTDGSSAETTTAPGGGGDGGGGGSEGPDRAFTGLVRALEAATVAAQQADEAARRDDATAADRRLRGLRQRTAAIADVIERKRDVLPDRLPSLVERRLPQVEARIEQALASDT